MNLKALSALPLVALAIAGCGAGSQTSNVAAAPSASTTDYTAQYPKSFTDQFSWDCLTNYTGPANTVGSACVCALEKVEATIPYARAAAEEAESGTAAFRKIIGDCTYSAAGGK